MLGHRTLSVEDYVAIVRRRWLLLLLPTLLAPLVAYLITFAIEPQYTSQTLVLIEQQQVPTDYVRPVITEDLDSRLASMREQILSRSSIEPIIAKYALYANKKMTMDDRVDQVRKSIDIKAIHSEIAQSNGLPGFFISYKANDAHTAQSVCGEITGLFVKQNLLERAAAVDQTTEFLQGQLTDAKRSLDEQDQKLAAFKRQYFDKLPGDENTNLNILSSLNTQLNASTQNIQNLEQNKSVVESMIAQLSQTPAPTSMIAAQTNQAQQDELQKLISDEADLTTHYTAENPDVRAVHRKIEELQKQMAKQAAAPPPPPVSTGSAPRPDSANLQSLRAQLSGYNVAIQNQRKQQGSIEAQIRSYEERIQSTPLVEEQYKELSRDYSTAQDLYNGLLTKINQSKMATDLEKRQQGEQFKIMDEPNLPDSPTFPKKGIFALGGLAAGIGIGMLITALLEYKNTALRSERDVWAFTQLPTLAVIAWSGEVAHVKPTRMQRLKHTLRLRRHKDHLIDANV